MSSDLENETDTLDNFSDDEYIEKPKPTRRYKKVAPEEDKRRRPAGGRKEKTPAQQAAWDKFQAHRKAYNDERRLKKAEEQAERVIKTTRVKEARKTVRKKKQDVEDELVAGIPDPSEKAKTLRKFHEQLHRCGFFG